MSLDEQMSAELAEELAANNTRRLVDPRGVKVRFSHLKQLDKSGLHYLGAVQGISKDTTARKLGRYAHALVLGGRMAPWTKKTKDGKCSPRNGKDWNAHKAANPDCEYPNEKELAHAKGIADAVKAHRRASELLYAPGTKYELELEWSYAGRACVSHLDAYKRGAAIVDLKGARDAHPERFTKTALWSHYHVQLAMYVMAVESLGHPTPDAYLVVVETDPPHPVTVMPIGPNAMEAGRRQVATWMAQLRQYEEANVWPPYAQDDVVLELPKDPLAAFFDPADVDI